MVAGDADRADMLYGLPLGEFVAARNALARELTREGDKARAAEVKGLGKPTRAAWALNQLARSRPAEVERLLQAGGRLLQAQRQALEGDARDLRAAARAEQEIVDQLVDASRVIDPSAPEDRLGKTLRAAATEPEIGALLQQGRLVVDAEPSGFGLEGLPAALVPLAAPPESDPSTPTAAEREGQRHLTREAERLRRAADVIVNRARRLADEADRAEGQAREARQQADAAALAAEEAERQADDAATRAGIAGP